MQDATEHQIQTEIIWYLRSLGAWCQRINSGALRVQRSGCKDSYVKLADRGTPDILACIKGHFVGIEVKRNEAAYKKWKKRDDATSMAQHLQCEMISESGGVYLCVYSVEQVEKDLQELGIL